MSTPSSQSATLQRIEDFRQLGRMQAGSLILSVFGDAVLPRGGRLWLGSLIDLLEPLGLNERLVRTSVFRLVKEEWLATQAVGRRTDYYLTVAGQRRFDEAARHIYAAQAPAWDRRWRLVMVVGELDPRTRDKLRRALFWQGFGDLGAGSFVHPSADLRQVFDALVTDGMAAVLPSLMPLLAANLQLGPAAHDSDMVRRAWDLDTLATGYLAFVQRYRPLLAEWQAPLAPGLDDATATLLRILLIHDYRRLLLRDPELPEVLLPTHWPGQQARQLCKDLYLQLLQPSERYLDGHLRLANGDVPLCTPLLQQRFQQHDPLNVPV
ncbi:MAG: phenylacetic acid degradation operon negative regulatory protein PaaX [Burkholderiaceae bacterium]|nr:phenylacetic acid degradation operon negative regulatory protein PaaX [Burkholderiaceae bacterium]